MTNCINRTDEEDNYPNALVDGLSAVYVDAVVDAVGAGNDEEVAKAVRLLALHSALIVIPDVIVIVGERPHHDKVDTLAAAADHRWILPSHLRIHCYKDGE